MSSAIAARTNGGPSPAIWWTGVCMIIVSTDDLAGAHRIFNVMNVRGLPLTAQDMLKAKAISSLPGPPIATTTVNVGTTPSTCWENRRNHSSIR